MDLGIFQKEYIEKKKMNPSVTVLYGGSGMTRWLSTGCRYASVIITLSKKAFPSFRDQPGRLDSLGLQNKRLNYPKSITVLSDFMVTVSSP